MNTSFKNLFNESSISTDSVTTQDLTVTGTLDITDAKIIGFPVDNVTIGIDSGVLVIKDFGINTQHLKNSAVHTSKIEIKQSQQKN